MDEYEVTGDGQLDLELPEPPASPAPDGPADDGSAGSGQGWDDWIDRGWDPGDHGDPVNDPDDQAAWLAGLPPEIREEYLAGAWTGAGEAIPAGFLHHVGCGPHGAGFAAGGALDTLAPGQWLAEALTTATEDGHVGLGESELIGVLCAWRRMSSWAAAGEAAAVLAVSARRSAQAAEQGTTFVAEHVTDELAAALTLTGRSADRLLSMAAGLDRLPAVHSALWQGHIDWPRACVLVSELAPLIDDELARAIADRLLGRAGPGGWTTGQLRAAARRAVLAADPESSARRRRAARKDAEVQTWDESSGNAALAGRELPPAEVMAADARLTALARWLQNRGAAGTISQLRAAVYCALLAGQPIESLLSGLTADDTAPSPETRPCHTGAAQPGAGQSGVEDPPADSAPNAQLDVAGRPAAAPPVSGTIHLTMPVSAWLGSAEPGEVAGHGPVDADTSRELARILAASPATTWCLTLTAVGGRAVAHACASRGLGAGEPVLRWAAGLRDRLRLLAAGDCGHTRQSVSYRPPSSLRHLVTVRQRTCAFPGCRRPAARCDLDHTIPYHKGGRTCECNLSPLCRRHHQAKQAPGWHLDQPRPGQLTWQLPSGRTYQTAGEPYAA